MYLRLPNGFRTLVLGYGKNNAKSVYFQTYGGTFILKLNHQSSESFIFDLETRATNPLVIGAGAGEVVSKEEYTTD